MYLLATFTYEEFAWLDLIRVAMIVFFGFEAGRVLNDYIDREYDRKDIETGKLTKNWRVFGTRPIPAGLVSPRVAVSLILVLSAITACLILTLPAPHSIYVLPLMLYCLAIERFYQKEKREQTILQSIITRPLIIPEPWFVVMCMNFIAVFHPYL